MKTDIEISQEYSPIPIKWIGAKIDYHDYELEYYGKYKAKVPYNSFGEKQGKLVLVTATNPTPMGEGKTTMSIGLADAMRQIGEDAMLCLREPSLGPVFGVKGGATGGGYAQVVPMEDINLHFTGDLHAIENANNLLAAMIDNHIFQGNELKIHEVTWKRCIDMNDRQLRNVISGYGAKSNGVLREDGFDITVASEVMAIFCLAKDIDDLKTRLGNIIIGYTMDKKAIFAKDLHAEGAMTALLLDAFNPNLVQTLEGTPAFIHGGPFANIAHGCNSLVATNLALSRADWVITEAGFGADLGAEKFLDIKCRMNGLAPNAIVLVTTIRALKHNGGALLSLADGLCNLERHIDNLKNFGIPVVVCLNKFPEDRDVEILLVDCICSKHNVKFAVSTAHADGGAGSIELANLVKEIATPEQPQLNHPYDLEMPLKAKINSLLTYEYGASYVKYSKQALDKINEIEAMEYGDLPICVAKTQYSFSDDPKLLGAPNGFEMTIKDVRLSAGAGFIVVICGNIMTMPGLPKTPAAENIDVINGRIVGLF